jgi:hypothetical protein
MGTKLMTVFARRYFEYGLILSLTSLLSVPKGDTYIWMVYNGTSSGMNAHLWAPWLALPTIYALARALEVGTFMGDSDIGEMFLNFMLEENCACFAGVDLTHYVPNKELAGEGRRHLVLWNRFLMGGTFSPYQTGQGMGYAKEMIMGDLHDCSKVFQWKEVRLNLPGVEDYDPSLSWVANIREDGRVAADLLIYMDDLP